MAYVLGFDAGGTFTDSVILDGINQKIIDAEPTDGLWNDGRNDTDQLGMTYAELENAMENKNDSNHQKYLEIRKKNLHKMDPIPVCKFNES